MHVSKSGWFELPIYNLNYQCNSCLYLYHNKLVGFVLQEKKHTMPITLVPELCCLIIARLRTRGQFKVLSFGFDQFSQDFRLRLFQAIFFSQLYFYQKETDGCLLSISAVFHSDRTSQSSTRSPPQNHINNNHIITLYITISVFHKLVSPSLSQRMNEKDRYVNHCFYSPQYEHKYTPHTHMYLYITAITKTPSLCCCLQLGHPFDNKMILFSCKKNNLIFELL